MASDAEKVQTTADPRTLAQLKAWISGVFENTRSRAHHRRTGSTPGISVPGGIADESPSSARAAGAGGYPATDDYHHLGDEYRGLGPARLVFHQDGVRSSLTPAFLAVVPVSGKAQDRRDRVFEAAQLNLSDNELE